MDKTIMPENEAFAPVAVIENAIEAQLLVSILKEEQIPHRIRSYHDTAYDGLFQTQKGWGSISAPIRYKHQIENILHQLRNTQSI